MKKLLLFALLLFRVSQLSAQAPQQFSFQGVARDAAGKVIAANTTVGLRLTIHKELPLGAILYRETHTPLTFSGGIFTASVGAGASEIGMFTDINWSTGNFFLQVELDAAGGTNYTDLGATQLLSVPFALHAGQADKWKNGDPVVQKGNINEGGVLNNIATEEAQLIWYPRKAAFRAGYPSQASWNDPGIGHYSVCFGIGTMSTGVGSVAMGQNSISSNSNSVALGSSAIASGQSSMSMGNGTRAIGNTSIAMGYSSEASGYTSIAAGYGTIAKAFNGVSLGIYNDNKDTPNDGTAQNTDRLFQIGNGTAANARFNAITILRNGKVGIGNNVLEPSHILDIGGRPRIRNNGGNNTAGLYFDDSNNSPEGFVGMKSNGEIGFYNAKKWLFWVDDLGNSHIFGTNYNTSDRRLKRDFTSLSSSLSKLTDLNGYHYFWKDSTLDQTLQTGVIAQEVEMHFPELVKTDDKGFKSVNYTGLIPHLIESVKELKASVEYLQNLNSSIKTQNETLKAQVSEIESLRKDFNKILDAAKLSQENVSASAEPDHTSLKSNRSEK